VSAPLRIALVGYGKIARDEHEPALAAVPGATLVAIADPAATHDGLPSFASLDALLAADPAVDAVALCMPPQHRFAAARTAILAGKHVFLEKPPAATLAEAEALIELARGAGVTLYVAWHSREAAAVAPARAWLIGKTLRDVVVTWKENADVTHPGQEWIWRPGGFGVFDPGINALSILSEILPEPVQVLGADLDAPDTRSAPVAARLRMATARGVPIAVTFDFRQQGPQSHFIDVTTDAGTLRLASSGNQLFIDGTEQPCGPEMEYARLYRRFVHLVGARQSDTDLTPLRLVTEALHLAE
jgi:D-galactose 1-dehydrogenase